MRKTVAALLMAIMALGLLAGDVTLTPGDDIQDALDNAGAGATVTLFPGAYNVSTTISITNGVTLKGVDRELVHLVADAGSIMIVKLAHADAVLSEVTVRGTSGSGGVYVTSGTVEDSIIRNNTSNSDGGGIILKNANAFLRRSVIKNNSSGSRYGGGCRLYSGTIENCLFTGNRGSWGGGIYAQDSGGRVINCTLIGNTAGGNATGPDFCIWSCTVQVTNSAMALFYSNMPSLPSANCLVTTDSSTKIGTTVASFDLNADSVPLAGSALLGAGISVPQNHYADGSAHGIPPNAGCYPAETNILHGVSVTRTTPELISPGENMTFEVSFGDASVSATGTLELFFPDGTKTSQPVADTESVTNVAGVIYGYYHVLLTVTDGGKSAKSRLFNTALVGANHLRVSPDSPNPRSPYSTWETAAHTIGAALADAVDGCTITVSNGTYEISVPLSVTKALRIESLAGKAETTVKQTSNARVFAIDHAGAIVKGFTIRNGRGGTGGGVYFGTNGGTLEDCTVEECLSTGNGGGVYLQAGAVLRRTVVRHCAHSTRSFGGGIYFNKGGYAENCLVYGCQSTWGCNAYSDGLNGAMVNCTIGHYPTPGAGNFYNYSSSFVATNCIFLGGVTSYSLSSSKCTLTDDPGWRDPSDGDYTLASTATAAIDAGDDDVLAYPASDIDGLARPKGAHVDIGCHEFDDTMFSCDISASATSIAVGGEVVFTPFVTAGSTPVITWRIVNLAGGAPIERVTEGSGETGACTVQFDAPGWYRVSLSVTDGTNHASAELNEHVTVSAAGDYFVSPSGSATPPFGSWATAATNLSAAVRLAGEGSAIHVAAGTWELMETITMDRALTLTGAGRDATFIRTPASSSFRALKLAHAAARARGFTLTATTGIGFVEVGVGAHVTAGRLENVRVCDCRATHNIDGIAVALNGNNAVLSHAIVNGNKNGSSGCINVRGGASIDNSLSYNNAAAYCGGLFVYGVGNGVTNCTINGNIGFQYNNGPAFSKLVNCVVNGSPSEWDATSVADGNAFVHCAFTAAQPGVGNVTDPLAFVDAVNGDFHLPPDSMCSGAGLFAPWMRRATDLDDKRRAYAGSVDIGCYQYPTPPAGSILLVK